MAAVALSALFNQLHRGTLLTFVLPGGCNLNCGFCFIERRGERNRTVRFQPKQYQSFIKDMAQHYPLSGVAVVGDEPLIENAWPLTHAILSTTRDLKLPSAVITNGTYLSSRAIGLSNLDVDVLLISLDAVGTLHDQLRGSPGCFHAIRAGLRSLAKQPQLMRNTYIASVAFPGRTDVLREFPPFLEQHGIQKWLLSPFLSFSEGDARVHPNVPPQLKQCLPELHSIARLKNVQLFVDDVLGTLSNDIFDESTSEIRLVRGAGKPLSLLRMAPDGRVTNLESVWKPLSPDLPRWDGLEAPHHFLHRCGLLRT